MCLMELGKKTVKRRKIRIGKVKKKWNLSEISKLSGGSLDIKAGQVEKLKSLFPQAIKDGEIDFDALKLALGGETDTNGQSYGLSWAGKADCFRHIQEATTATLKPIRGESVDFDNTENIFIEGDNLEVLKVLQKNYYGKVKMIYIDPPYNTGKDSFIYPDRFKEERAEYEERAGIKDAEGLLTKDGFFRKNSKDTGHFHSNWLSMMYPRLFLAKNLLREDGVIFVSIDDNEVHNLRMIMNEVFGEENWINTLIWKKRYNAAKEKQLATIHDYVLIYARNETLINDFFVPADTEYFEKYFTEKDEYFAERGSFMTQPLEAGNSMDDRENLRFPITAPDSSQIWPRRQWVWGQNRVEAAQKKGYLKFYKNKDDDWAVRHKQYTKDEDGNTKKVKPFTIYDKVYTQDGTKEFEELFSNSGIFPFPKPSRFVSHLMQLTNDSNAIYLDFFSGSCTTAHAVMQLNAEDGGNRKYICVQLAEPCDEKSEAFKAGYKTIADIGKERIRRAGKKIKKESSGKLDFDGGKLDLGFKVFKLDESNFKQWRADIKTGEELKEQMKMFVDNKKKGSAPEDMLYEIILKNSRFDLNVKLEKKTFDGIEYCNLTDGQEIICLADKITKKLAEKILKEKPQKFTCLDTAFKNNDQLKTNTALQMEAAKIEFKVI